MSKEKQLIDNENISNHGIAILDEQKPVLPKESKQITTEDNEESVLQSLPEISHQKGLSQEKKFNRFYIWKSKQNKKIIDDVLLTPHDNYHIFNNIPINPEKLKEKKTVHDIRNGKDNFAPSKSLPKHHGRRYTAQIPVTITCIMEDGKKYKFIETSNNISSSGIRMQCTDKSHADIIEKAKSIKLKLKVIPGVMPEGYEMKVNIPAKHRHTLYTENGEIFSGLQFEPSLSEYAYKRRSRVLRIAAISLILILIFFVIIMRVESVLYVRFNRIVYIYSIITAIYLLSRYLISFLYKPVPINDDFTPAVSIIIPCFNEEEWIQQTILSCADQDYPIDKLEVILVDDCSNDNSMEKVEEIIHSLWEMDPVYDFKNRISYMKMPENKGKREALAAGVKQAKHDLVVFVDSDSFLDSSAIRNLVQPFQNPRMGGVTGRTDVANTYTNALTKMQSVRYYIAFRVMKAAESYFDAVTCLSGPISCYKKSIIMENLDAWLEQTFLGRKATFGDDRAMTNFVLKKHRTAYQDSAICSTIVPNKHKQFLKQQMRWKRSWLRETILASRFMWKKEPIMAIFFYLGFLIPFLSPLIVVFNLFYIPIVNGIFPLIFLWGLGIMAFIMSAAHLLYRRSSIWMYGALFCVYYVGVLLWQMPIACVTFWKSTWGTRMTPHDISAAAKKARRKECKQRKAGAAVGNK